MASQGLTVRALIDQSPIGALQLSVATLLTSVMILEGLDLQLASFSAPVLMAEWHLSKPQLAPLLAAAMIGMAVGSLIGSWAGDRVGRKATLVGSVAFFGLMTAACETAFDPRYFIAYRFLSGLGFGAAFPVATAMMSEWMPNRAAGKAISIMTIGIPVGTMVGAFATSLMLPQLGWKYCFAAAGSLCLLFSAFLFWLLPESPSYLMLNDRRSEATALLIKAWKRPIAPELLSAASDPKVQNARGLFGRRNSRVNIGLWLAVLANSCATYVNTNWLTVVLVGFGLPLATALRGPLTISFSAIAGALLVGSLLNRLGSRRTMLLFTGLAAASALAMSAAAYAWPQGRPLYTALFIGLAVTGFCTGGLQPAFYVLAARVYDTGIRARGIGIAALVGRVGAILSSFLGGAVLAMAHESGYFAMIGTLVAISIVGILIVDRHTARVVETDSP